MWGLDNLPGGCDINPCLARKNQGRCRDEHTCQDDGGSPLEAWHSVSLHKLLTFRLFEARQVVVVDVRKLCCQQDTT